MDSFVLAETFKYLYLLFSEKEDIVFNVNQFIFTTEAHLLPLSLSTMAVNASASQVKTDWWCDCSLEHRGFHSNWSEFKLWLGSLSCFLGQDILL